MRYAHSNNSKTTIKTIYQTCRSNWNWTSWTIFGRHETLNRVPIRHRNGSEQAGFAPRINENALQTEIAAKLHKLKYLYLYKCLLLLWLCGICSHVWGHTHVWMVFHVRSTRCFPLFGFFFRKVIDEENNSSNALHSKAITTMVCVCVCVCFFLDTYQNMCVRFQSKRKNTDLRKTKHQIEIMLVCACNNNTRTHCHFARWSTDEFEFNNANEWKRCSANENAA